MKTSGLPKQVAFEKVELCMHMPIQGQSSPSSQAKDSSFDQGRQHTRVS